MSKQSDLVNVTQGETLKIDHDTGRVGIGITNPTTALDVSGRIRSIDAAMVLQSTGELLTTGIGFFSFQSNNQVERGWLGFGYGNGDFGIVNTNSANMIFRNGSSERLRIASDGRVTIQRDLILGGDHSIRSVNTFRYQSLLSLGNVYIHMKTNRSPNTESQMYSVTFRGHSYGQSSPINASLVFYNYSTNGTVINIGSHGTHTCSAYESSDGFTVLTIYTPGHYYVAFTMDQFTTGQGLAPLTITNVTTSASATGVF